MSYSHQLVTRWSEPLPCNYRMGLSVRPLGSILLISSDSVVLLIIIPSRINSLVPRFKFVLLSAHRMFNLRKRHEKLRAACVTSLCHDMTENRAYTPLIPGSHLLTLTSLGSLNEHHWSGGEEANKRSRSNEARVARQRTMLVRLQKASRAHRQPKHRI